jgi:hypothetical protein
MRKLCYYISGHGLGHASRSGQILAALAEHYPAITIKVVTDAPTWFLRDNLPPTVKVSCRRLDVGVVQSDSLHMQLDATLAACRALIARADCLVAAEAASLQTAGIDLVVTDVPAIACLAAESAGCPAVILSNFTWDWIYAGFVPGQPGFNEIIDWHRAAYSRASLVLRLPFHAPMDHGAPAEDLPLVARRCQHSASEVRRQLKIRRNQNLALLSFGGFGLTGANLESLATLENWAFLGDPGLAGQAQNLRPLPEGFSYPDLVNAADVVITKPGYGIVAEGIAHGTAVLYTSRGAFREQALLIEGLHQYTRALEIGNRDLLTGDWHDPLQQLLRQPSPSAPPPTNGALVAAHRLASLLGVETAA